MERFRSDNDLKTTKPEPWVLRLGNYLMSKKLSEPMVLRLGNYLKKQPDGISTKETVLNETSEDEIPEREGEGPVEMNQNNHHGPRREQPEQPRRDEDRQPTVTKKLGQTLGHLQERVFQPPPETAIRRPPEFASHC